MSRVKKFIAAYFADMKGGWACGPTAMFVVGAIFCLAIFSFEPITITVCLLIAALFFWLARRTALWLKSDAAKNGDTEEVVPTVKRTGLISVSFGDSYSTYTYRWPFSTYPTPGDWILVPGPRGGRKRAQVMEVGVDCPRGFRKSQLKEALGWAKPQR